MEYPPEKAAKICGIEAELIREVARLEASVKPMMLCYTLGITQHTCGTKNMLSVANLQMLLGNMGVECGGVNSLRGQNNVQGACDMGALPNMFPNETTKFAHVVFPAAAWNENDGMFTNSERRGSRVRTASKPPGIAKPTWWIFKQIAKRLGHNWVSDSARELWDNEISVMAPNTDRVP